LFGIVYNSFIKERGVLLNIGGLMKQYNEAQILKLQEYINSEQLKKGKSPSYREIMKNVGFSSLSVAYRYVDLLAQRGVISKEAFGGIALSQNLTRGQVTIAPVVGTVTCGKPILAQENIEGIEQLPAGIFGSGDLFLLHAQGDSMEEVGIMDGDLLVVKQTNCAENGQIVVALIDDSATVKTFYKHNDHIVLHPENSRYEDIIVKDVTILGVVGHCIHKL